ELVVGTVCLLEERKGLLALVEAMPRVIQTVGDVRFVIVGEGPLKGRMQQRIAELGIADRVDFLGWRFDVPDLMSQFDVFALASLRESFGLVYLEAMACRCPVVAARVDGVPEVVSDGETGILVPPASPAELARALCRVLSDEATRKRMGAAGRRRVVDLFDVRRMAAAYEALYARLLAQPDAAAARFALPADTGHSIK
ncbi:MAG TPA: glycosyltransferase family 4 protein, partial [Burkholderiales bacterium]|nr:glycosyltransferase family 4 protein [Burkholderiales bacterium]